MTKEDRANRQTRLIASVIAERHRVFGIELPDTWRRHWRKRRRKVRKVPRINGPCRIHSERAVINRQVFLFGDAFDFVGDFFEARRTQLKKQRSRLDHLRQIFGTSRRQDKNRPLG